MIETLQDAVNIARCSREYLTLPENIGKLLPYCKEPHFDLDIFGEHVEFEHIGLNHYVILVLEI